jgi:PAS domain S-box-containing protein
MWQINTLLEVLSRIQDSVLALDNNGVVTYVNPAFAKLSGYAPQDLVGKKIQPLLPQGPQTIIYQNVQQAIATKQPQRFEWQGLFGHACLETTVFPSADGVTIITKDISEHKKALEALRQSEQRFRTVFEKTSLGLVVGDMEGRVLDVNSALEAMSGYSKEELQGKLYTEFLPPGCTQISETLVEHVKSGVLPNFSFEKRFTRKDGTEIWVNLVGTLVLGADQQPEICIVTVEDITQRKLNSEKLQDYTRNLERMDAESTQKVEQVAQYARSLIEASLDPLVTINAAGKITDVNEATVLITGCSREELIGSDFSDYFTDPQKAKRIYKRVFVQGKIRDYPLAIKHKSGAVTDVMYNASVFKNSQGEIQGVFAAARDVTERNRAEAEVREAAKQLRVAERLAAIGATAGMVGHDIRNPLQAIVSDVYLLKLDLASLPEMETKQSITESLESIEENITYINKIVADLQDYARPLYPETSLVDLPRLICSVIDPLKIPENINLRFEASEVSTLETDATFLKRVLTNLIINAVQAMPDGGDLTINAKVKGKKCQIIIQDTGVGIPEKVKPKLFTPMVTTKSKGQGLGLAVVKRLVEALNGAVTFESVENKGTKFIVSLPLC